MNKLCLTMVMMTNKGKGQSFMVEVGGGVKVTQHWWITTGVLGHAIIDVCIAL